MFPHDLTQISLRYKGFSDMYVFFSFVGKWRFANPARECTVAEEEQLQLGVSARPGRRQEEVLA